MSNVQHSLLLSARLLALIIIPIFLPQTAAQSALPVTDGYDSLTLAPMLEKTTPAVVNLSTEESQAAFHNSLLDDPFFRRFLDIPDQLRERKGQSVGSGVVVDASHGYVITNCHVIDGADTINVTLRDGRKLDAKVIGSDRESDVAVIQIPSTNLTALNLADSDKMRVGDFVVAIGNPFGLGQTVTSGIVSALGRSGLGIQGYEDFIQTDASINPGNSGGALVNLHGELVGINTAIIAPGGGNVGIGFAIPANMVSHIMNQIITYGTVHRGHLGVSVQDLTPNLARAFNISAEHGAVIAAVSPRSAAASAGIKEGDVVLSVNNRSIRDGSNLRNAIGLLEVGESVRLDILRGSNTLIINTKVDEYASNVSVDGALIHKRLSGATLEDINPNSLLPGQAGVLVTSVKSGSPAANGGLYRNDVIMGINRKAISNISEFKKIAADSDRIMLKLLRGQDELLLLLH